MRLLVLTQAVDRNDPVLGFFHQWIKEFSRHTDEVIVGCLREGEYELPQNVRVVSFGKERGVSRIGIVRNFFRLIVREQKHYDAVFVHMNPEYAALAGFLWRMWGKRVALWYTHRNTDLKLRLAEKFTHVICTASPEGFRISSKKVVPIGHGIDTSAFYCSERKREVQPLILHVGRITPIKNCGVLIDAMKILRDDMNISCRAVFIGAPAAMGDEAYFTKLRERVQELELESHVEFVGAVTQADLPSWYCRSAVTVNMTPTGGVDKAVLESMAAGVPVCVSNQAFVPYFGEYASMLMFPEKDARALAGKIRDILGAPEARQAALRSFLERVAAEKASVAALIPRILEYLR